jgi:hypothetical protein
VSTRSRGFTHARAGTNHFELMKRFRSSLLFFSLLSAVLSVAQVCFAQVNSARMLSGINAQTGTSYTFVALDSTRITTFSNGSAVAVTLPTGSTTNFGAGSVFSAKNIGAGTVTITCSSCTINATGTPASTFAMATGVSVDLYSDGVNYTAFVYNVASGGSSNPTFFTGFNKWMGYSPTAGNTCQTGNQVIYAPFGVATFTVAGNAVAVASTSTEAAGCDYGTNGSTQTAYFELDSSNAVNTGVMQEFRARVGNVTSLTPEIFFVGVGATLPYSSAAPAGATLSFRCATTVPDTNWQAMVSGVAHDSGVACDHALHTFRITISGTTATYYIDGTQVYQQVGSLPSAGTNMSPFVSLSNGAGSNVENIQISYMFVSFNTP